MLSDELGTPVVLSCVAIPMYTAYLLQPQLPFSL